MNGSATPVFFDRTYNEAMALLVEARDHARAICESRPRAAPADALAISREAFRLTTRLTQIMSWLLARRALLNDELTPQELATRDWRLGAQTVCCDDTGRHHDAVSPRLRDLLRRSHHLYERISRLDGAGTYGHPGPLAWQTPGVRKPNA